MPTYILLLNIIFNKSYLLQLYTVHTNFTSRTLLQTPIKLTLDYIRGQLLGITTPCLIRRYLLIYLQ
jgi:hypothetical protein